MTGPRLCFHLSHKISEAALTGVCCNFGRMVFIWLCHLSVFLMEKPYRLLYTVLADALGLGIQIGIGGDKV